MGKSPSVQQVEAPKTYVQATAPDPEETAEAPTVNGSAQTADERAKKKKGTAALTIDLNLNGGGNGMGGGSGVNVPY